MSAILDEIRKVPIVTRFLCGSAVGISVPVILAVLPFDKVVFIRQLVTQRFEVCQAE